MKSLLHYFKNYLKESFLGPIFKLLEASFELTVPLVIAFIVDSIIPHSNQGNLIAMVLLLIVLAVIGVIVAITAQYYSAKAAVGFTRVLTADLYQKVLSLPKSSRDRLSISSLLTRLSSDTLQIQTGINTFLRLFLRAPIVVFGALILAFSISPRLSVLFLIMIIILFMIVIVISRVSSCLFAQIRQNLDKIVGLVQENILGVRVIRAFGQKEREIAGFEEQNQIFFKGQMKAGYWSAALTPLTFFVVNATLLTLIWQGKIAVGQSLLEQGQLVALINYLLQILTELVKIVMVVSTLNQTFVSADRVREIFELQSEDILSPLETVVSEDKSLLLRLQQVNFTYPEAAEAALKGINFQVRHGEFFGVIGGTGSGKSTLFDLFLCLYPATSGSVQLFQDGKSPQHLKDWRGMFALVPQQAQLFSGDVRSNLTLGLENISDNAIWRALDIAQASEFLREKNGLDTIVEAFGRNFSGGQRQRLTIARALLQPASILLLDDATSALDYLTENRFLQALERDMPDKTVIMISQRTSSLARAQQILVLDKGEQVGLGSHEQLLASCSVYREIHESQHRQEVAE